MSTAPAIPLEVIRLSTRLEWLASAGIRITVDNAQTADEWIEAAPGVQAIFECLESMANDLNRRLETMEREMRA